MMLVDDLGALIARAVRRGALIAIDMPIGLADDGPRACDLEARRMLGCPRGSGVFAPPCRSALAATTYERACALSRRALGVALSSERNRAMDIRSTLGKVARDVIAHHREAS